MNPSTKEIGGGPTVGLSKDFVSALQSLLNFGGTGTAGSPDAMGTTGGVYGILQDLLSPGAGAMGKNLTELFSKQSERDVAGLRSRFTTGGGTGFGTPAAYAESLYRSESAPKMAQAVGGLQLSALGPILAQLGQFSSMGIAPRQIVQEQSPFSQVLGTIAPALSAAVPFLGPAFGAAGTAGAASSLGSKATAYASDFQ